MAEVIIYKNNGTVAGGDAARTVTCVTSATQKITLNGANTVDVTVTSTVAQTFDVGDYIKVFGTKYTLNRPANVRKTGAHKFEYTMEFESPQYDLLRAMFNVNIDTTNNQIQDISGDSLTGGLKRFLDVLVSNANRVFPGKWVSGTCPDTADDVTMTFGETDNCLGVLQNLCEKFETEFDIVTNADGTFTINFGTVGRKLTYTFMYGRGNGLYSLRRDNVSNSNIITRLMVYGSTENITNKYRANRLCLPGKTKAQSFLTDDDAVAKYGIFEATKYFDDIKPSYTGYVTGITSDVMQFVDESFPFDLNATNADGETLYLVAGTSAKIHFNSGNLAGYEFEVKSYDHSKHLFTLKPITDERGMVFPNADSKAFQLTAKDGSYTGDSYKIVDINYPDDITTKAENTLLEKGTEYFNQNKRPRVKYSCEVTKQYLEAMFDPSAVANVFMPGDYLHIVDDDLDIDDSIRITTIERNVLDEYDYKLTISDQPVKISNITSVIADQIATDKIITTNHLADPVRARNNWRTAQELLSMVFDTDGDYYTEKIRPLSIETAMLAVGARSQQFVLKDVMFQPNYGGDYTKFRVTAGSLVHYTIDPDKTRGWSMSANQYTLYENEAYYIYAVCNKTVGIGSFGIGTQQFKLESLPGWWFFLVGTISSPVTQSDGSKQRFVSLTYGFSTINGRFVRTGRIESNAGTTYFDLDDGVISGQIKFIGSDGATHDVADTNDAANEAKDYINNTLPGLLDGMQSQIDGQIEQWFYDYDPSDTTEPTKTWIADGKQAQHAGDLFYNTSSGKVWRYVKQLQLSKQNQSNIDKYYWQQLSDEDAAKALQTANDALDLARTKRRIFTSTPYTPYEVGDLWVNGGQYGNDIMRCATSRLTGNFTMSDWVKASDYTNDDALHEFIDNDFADTVSELKDQVDGKIETWFGQSDPATAWTTDALKKAHNGDLWFNTGNNTLWHYVVTSTTDSDGNTTVTGTWEQIHDQAAIDAAAAASTAQDTADGKRQVFVRQPTSSDEYEIGDLWVNATYGDYNNALLRCVKAKAKGVAFNINHWAKATNYDNTQTTIDGGIVTSGTVQVAGDEKYILAGITGKGTASDSVRFWAGSEFETRASAPYRVLQNGKVIMTDADVSGTINSKSGYIGGFKISQGQIGVGNGQEQENYAGLCLVNSFIRFRTSDGNQETRMGCMNSLGYPYNGYMAMFGDKYMMGTVLELHQGHTDNDASCEWISTPRALQVFGNQKNIGRTALFDTGYIGQAYTDIIETWFNITHKFHFTANGLSNLKMNLPTKTQVDNAVKHSVKGTTRTPDVIFDIEVVCDMSMPNRITFQSQAGAQMYNNNGGTMDTYACEKGDTVVFRYYNGRYYIITTRE